MTTAALVVLSGGQDSTTCLFWAKREYGEVHAVTFDYGQRHSRELHAAARTARLARVSSHETVSVPDVLAGSSPLINHAMRVGQYSSEKDLPGGIEPTFVPARNALFMTIAANRAVKLGIRDIIVGVSQEDFGGYPDCRRKFVELMEAALSEGIYGEPDKLRIITPLIDLTKKETVECAKALGSECWEALAYTHTCYNGSWPPCGSCHACILRKKGFDEAGHIDPLAEEGVR